jgi:hypothetical protein
MSGIDLLRTTDCDYAASVVQEHAADDQKIDDRQHRIEALR